MIVVNNTKALEWVQQQQRKYFYCLISKYRISEGIFSSVYCFCLMSVIKNESGLNLSRDHLRIVKDKKIIAKT